MRTFGFAIALAAASCGDSSGSPSPYQGDFEVGDEAPTELTFRDITAESPDLWDITSHGNPGWNTSDKYAPGVALVDLDGDGNLDLVQPRNDASRASYSTTHLFRGLGDGTFVHATPEGWQSSSPAIVALAFDMDGDDDLDLFVGIDGEPSRLYRNEGEFDFTDVTSASGLADYSDRVFAASAGDINNDGSVDLYIGTWNASAENNGPGTAPNRLFLNNGAGVFTELEEAAPCHGRSTLATALVDFDGDGKLDIYVANDFYDDCLYHNLGGGEFVDIAPTAGTDASSISAMGTAAGDLNNDGLVDLLVTDGTKADASIGNAVFINRGGMTFDNAGEALGLGTFDSILLGPETMFGWGAGIFDFDLDGDNDVHVVTHVTVEEVFYQQNRGGFVVADDMTFTLDDADGRGSAYGDIDNDGDIDVVVARRGDGAYIAEPQPLQILRNDTLTTHGSVTIDIRPLSLAIGATVRVTANGRTQVSTITAGSSYASCNPPTALIGVGEATIIDSIAITPLGGSPTVISDVSVGERVVIDLE